MPTPEDLALQRARIVVENTEKAGTNLFGILQALEDVDAGQSMAFVALNGGASSDSDKEAHGKVTTEMFRVALLAALAEKGISHSGADGET